MTHEYVIALGGSVAGVSDPDAVVEPTAIAWAADRVLAVGTDAVVRAISRGDSTFLDLAGAAVTAMPPDPAGAETAIASAGRTGDPVPARAGAIQAGLERTGRSMAGARLEPGSPADLAIWAGGGEAGTDAGPASAPRIVAVVRDGAFTVGDPHTGPFRRLVGTSGGDHD